jgi:hypothetical protein
MSAKITSTKPSTSGNHAADFGEALSNAYEVAHTDIEGAALTKLQKDLPKLGQALEDMQAAAAKQGGSASLQSFKMNGETWYAIGRFEEDDVKIFYYSPKGELAHSEDVGD